MSYSELDVGINVYPNITQGFSGLTCVAEKLRECCLIRPLAA